MNVLIVGPALRKQGRGNHRTAVRWGRLLARLGHEVACDDAYRDQDCDLLVALHAIYSADSLRRFRAAHPTRPAVLALTGTDIYGLGESFDAAGRERARGALERATAAIVLHPLAVAEVPQHLRPKVHVVTQSVHPLADAPAPRGDVFEVCVMGELRAVKDPFRTAAAARRLPPDSTVRVVHAGAAGTREFAAQATAEQQTNPRYRWLGEIPHRAALALIGRSRVLSITSRHEGGPNVLTEALGLGTPIIASRVPGTVGLLGNDYPGYFEVGDSQALSDLLHRAETDRGFLRELEDRCRGRAELASPAREAEAWVALLSSLSCSTRGATS